VVEHFREGEWDNSSTFLGLMLAQADACYARLQVVKLKAPTGAESESTFSHFCAVVGCTIMGHQLESKKVPPGEQHEGWLLQVGSTSQGVIEHMWFPLHESGEPITSGAAASLLDCTAPFKISPGQWWLLLSKHQASRVEALSSVEPLSVDTGALPRRFGSKRP